MFCFFTLSFNIYAQEFSIENFTAREGLANDNIRSMAIDSSGFLWIATWDGISRYDGYTFKNFYHHPNDSLSLPYFSTQQIEIDGGNNLWLLTDDYNVAWFDRNNGIFVSLEKLYHKMAKPYRSICVDESGFMWIVKSDSIFRYNYRNKNFEEFALLDESAKPMKIDEGFPLTVSITKDNKLWIVFEKVYEFSVVSDNLLIL
jgi:ligand-binding sensor domain-containing protein